MSDKKLRSKITSIMLALILALSFSVPVSVAGEPIDTGAIIMVDTVEAVGGDKDVVVPVYIENCPAFFGMGLELTFDTSGLEFKSIEAGANVVGATLDYGPVYCPAPFASSICGAKLNFVSTSFDTMFADGEILLLTFDVKDAADSDDYYINLAISDAGWNDSDNNNLTGTFVDGAISVTPKESLPREAEYDGKEYLYLKTALNKAIASGSPATVKVLEDITVLSYTLNQIIIPDGADIELDLNGYTITSKIGDPNIIVNVGGQLNIVDSSAEKMGKFLNDYTAAAISVFLQNQGTFAMNDVDVINYHQALDIQGGVVSKIENCTIESTVALKNAIVIAHGAEVEEITNCTITAAQEPLKVEGKLGLLDGSTIESERTGDLVDIRALFVSSTGEIGTIKDSTIKNVVGNSSNGVLDNKGTIGLITSTSEANHTSIIGGDITAIVNYGTIGSIESDYTVIESSSGKALQNRDNATIGGIVGGIFNSVANNALQNDGIITEISGGIFTSTNTNVLQTGKTGTIDTISGGEFNSLESYAATNYATINTINGGKFNSSTGYGFFNFGPINNINGGEFRNAEGPALLHVSGTIVNITDGIFQGTTNAIANPAPIEYVTGGYYKNNSNGSDPFISDMDTGILNPSEGYNFSTQPMQESDFGEARFYHYGKTVDTTWKVEENTIATDKFVIDDPVYYNYEELEDLVGWEDESGIFYRKDVPLPITTADTIYTAVFFSQAKDYQIYLINAPDGVYQGEDFIIDVVITSENNTVFHGATIDIIFDKEKVTFDDESSEYSDDFGLGLPAKNNETLTIVGAYSNDNSNDGFTLENGSYKIATLSFTAKENTTGDAIFSFGEDRIVDQKDAIQSVTVDVGGDVTVTLSQIIVEFNSKGGSTVDNQILNYGEKITKPDNPTKNGYHFKGWYVNEEFEEPSFDFDTAITSGLTLYAKWDINQYTLKYSADNNGSITGDVEQTVDYGQSGSEVKAAPNNGYHFVKWSDGSTDNPRTDTNVATDIDVTAEFAATEYSITYNLDGGTNDENNPDKYTIESQTITLADASKTGYTFDGWYDATSGGNEVTEIAKGSTGDVNLYAYWTANKYTVTFNGNGGGTPTPASMEVTYGATYGDLATVTRTGHDFLGWFTEATGGEEVTAETIVSSAEEHTLYAHWEHIIYTVTFKAGDNVTMNNATAYAKHYTNAEDLGLWANEECTEKFNEPNPVAVNGYTLDEKAWKPESGENVNFDTIKVMEFTGDAVYTATASPSKYNVIYTENRVNFVSGFEDNKATYPTDIVFTVVKNTSYLPIVEYKIGNDNFKLMAATDGKYTIVGSEILGDIEIKVTDTLEGAVSFIGNDDFNALPTGQKLLLFSAPVKLTEGAYQYNGESMFYSAGYSTEDGVQVYVFVVPNGVDAVTAMDNIEINDTAELCTELNYDGDVNLDSKINSTDAVLTHGLFKGLHKDVNPELIMQMRLEADVNHSTAVDIFDALTILNKIWGK